MNLQVEDETLKSRSISSQSIHPVLLDLMSQVKLGNQTQHADWFCLARVALCWIRNCSLLSPDEVWCEWVSFSVYRRFVYWFYQSFSTRPQGNQVNPLSNLYINVPSFSENRQNITKLGDSMICTCQCYKTRLVALPKEERSGFTNHSRK